MYAKSPRIVQSANSYFQSPKFKRVLLNETPEFPFWGHGNCVDFDLRNLKNEEYEET